VADLQAAGIDARWIAADCAKEEDIRKLADQTSSAWATSTSW
jgi:gluconate 5-dehydrogenase